MLLFFVSCQNKSLFSQYKSIKTAWDIDRSIFFKFNISDTINPYNLFIKLRTDNDYEFNNLFLDNKTSESNGYRPYLFCRTYQ